MPLEECPTCRGLTNQAGPDGRPCGVCGGVGRVAPPGGGDGKELDAAAAACLEEVLEFWGLVRWARLGPALRLWGLRRIDPLGLAALQRLDGQLAELEARRRREEVERARRARR